MTKTISIDDLEELASEALLVKTWANPPEEFIEYQRSCFDEEKPQHPKVILINKLIGDGFIMIAQKEVDLLPEGPQFTPWEKAIIAADPDNAMIQDLQFDVFDEDRGRNLRGQEIEEIIATYSKVWDFQLSMLKNEPDENGPYYIDFGARWYRD
ncbi:hypothetical protein [Gimibacter soli]|uniref:Uncharacterized protein n=1 Tax=Gimibacter soli TaxID=3024400 RepID=A0AAF0BLI9_9PROT|nr:hypothetical protein [Gimibacter soli]WCL53490.1 hypothetical protein PH603_13175 [Gimibacter soli]